MLDHDGPRKGPSCFPEMPLGALGAVRGRCYDRSARFRADARLR